jgi:hypothetical protein
MRNITLTLSHPIDDLEHYDLDPSTWDPLDPPELYLVDSSALIPLVSTYMPHFLAPQVEARGPIQLDTDGRCKHFFKLTREINSQWLQCFEMHRGDADVTFDRDQIVLGSRPDDLGKLFEEVIYGKLHRATNDYRQERENLVWHVFEKMQRMERREHVEGEILAAFTNYRREKQERISLAQRNGWSVPIILQHYNQEYREILENKFTRLWEKSLDNSTIRRYRALFEQEFLVL